MTYPRLQAGKELKLQCVLVCLRLHGQGRELVLIHERLITENIKYLQC